MLMVFKKSIINVGDDLLHEFEEEHLHQVDSDQEDDYQEENEEEEEVGENRIDADSDGELYLVVRVDGDGEPYAANGDVNVEQELSDDEEEDDDHVIETDETIDEEQVHELMDAVMNALPLGDEGLPRDSDNRKKVELLNFLLECGCSEKAYGSFVNSYLNNPSINPKSLKTLKRQVMKLAKLVFQLKVVVQGKEGFHI